MTDQSGGTLDYDVVSLDSLADEKYALLRERVMECLREFKCSRSSHLEDYARRAVSLWEAHGHSRTYVFLAPHGDDIAVPAFFAVGMNVLSFENATPSAKKKLRGSISQDQTGAFCITELARHDDYSSEQLPGSVILDEAKSVVREARKFIGGRYLVVDSTEAVFESLYSNYGFKKIGLKEPPKGMEDLEFVTSCCVIKDW